MMRYHRYGVNIVFVKGTNLHLVDTLTRAYLDFSEENQDNRFRIMDVNPFGDLPDNWLNQIRDATSR